MALLLKLHQKLMKTPLRGPVEKNLGHPKGLWGAYVAWLMNQVNIGITKHTLDQLELSAGQQVLEIGFGGGVSFDLIFPRIAGGHLTGLDMSEAMVRRCSRERAEDIAAGRLRLQLGVVAAMPFPDASFDRAFGVNTTYFWPDMTAGLKDLCRVLKPGGRVALGIRGRAAMMKLGMARPPFRHYEDDEYMKFFKDAGFRHFEIASIELGKIETQALIGVK